MARFGSHTPKVLALTIVFLFVASGMAVGLAASRDRSPDPGAPVAVAPSMVAAPGTHGRTPAVSTSPGPSFPRPSIQSTLDLLNDTMIPGNYTAYSDQIPGGIAWDPEQGDLAVTGYTTEYFGSIPYEGWIGGGAVETFDTIHSDFNDSSACGVGPDQITYLSTDQDFFDADAYAPQVCVTTAGSLAPVEKIKLPSEAYALASDPVNSTVFATLPSNDTVAELTAASTTPVWNISVAGAPIGIAYDRLANALFIGLNGTGRVPELNASTGRVIGNVSLIAAAFAFAVNQTSGVLYAAEPACACVQSIDPVFDFTTGTARVGVGPISLAWDPDTNDVYVLNYYSENVTILRTAHNISAGSSDQLAGAPWGIAYDPANSEMYVTMDDPAAIAAITSIGIITKTAQTSVYPEQATFAPGEGTGYVSLEGYVPGDVAGNVLAFNESTGRYDRSYTAGSAAYGLAYVGGQELFIANQATYNLTEDDVSTGKSTRSVPVGEGLGLIAYDPIAGTILGSTTTDSLVAINATSGIFSLEVVGSRNTTDVVYDPVNGYGYIAESALNNVTDNFSSNVSVVDLANGDIEGTVGTGSFASGMAVDPTNGQVWVANLDSGNVTVLTNARSPAINRTIDLGPNALASGVAYDPADHSMWVADAESGNVTIFDPATGAVEGSVTVGGSPDALAVDPATGYVAVLDPVEDEVKLIAPGPPTHFAVDFVSEGLGANVSWSVKVGSDTYTASNATISVSLVNDTYAWQLENLTCNTANRTSGPFDVAGAPVTIRIGFTYNGQGYCAVQFEPTGLPGGTLWSLRFAGLDYALSGDSLVNRNSPAGTYSFQIYEPTGYTGAPEFGNVTASGAGNISVALTFTANKTVNTVNPSSGGFSLSTTEWAILGIGVAVIAILAIWFATRRAPPRASHVPEPEPAEATPTESEPPAPDVEPPTT
jgi:YVTN family beta-propeller protein